MAISQATEMICTGKSTGAQNTLRAIVLNRLRSNESFARIVSKGDKALFCGRSTQDMKNRLDVPKGRALADFLPTITIKAKDFANEITNVNVKEHNLRTENGITGEHVKNNEGVRELLRDRGITPEQLPPAEDVKKVERRIVAEQRKLPKQTKRKGKWPNDPVQSCSFLIIFLLVPTRRASRRAAGTP